MTPNDAGISLAVIRHYAGRGLRCWAFRSSSGDGAGLARVGGAVKRKYLTVKRHQPRIMDRACFRGLPTPVNRDTLPLADCRPRHVARKCFEITARAKTQEIMGIRHREWDLEGVQFHPESILSEQDTRYWKIFFSTLINGCH